MQLRNCFTKHWIDLFICECKNNMKVFIVNALVMLANIKKLPFVESAIIATSKLYTA